jgi:hypothetical protein
MSLATEEMTPCPGCGDLTFEVGPCFRCSALGKARSSDINGVFDKLTGRLYELLDRPDEWSTSTHTLDHISGVKLWIPNGRNYLAVKEPADIDFTDQVKDLLWPKIETIIGGLDELKASRKAAKIQTVLDKLDSTQVEVPA